MNVLWHTRALDGTAGDGLDIPKSKILRKIGPFNCCNHCSKSNNISKRSCAQHLAQINAYSHTHSTVHTPISQANDDFSAFFSSPLRLISAAPTPFFSHHPSHESLKLLPSTRLFSPSRSPPTSLCPAGVPKYPQQPNPPPSPLSYAPSA